MRLRSITMLLIVVTLVSACGNTGATNPAGASPLEISLVYSSEKQTWIEPMVQAFNAQQVKSTTGKPIQVTATPMGSTDAMTQILSGTLTPTVWSPASALVIPVANDRWAPQHAAAPLISDAPSLVRSPMVIAMWEPMARALGWPTKALGWSDLAALASSGKTWADYGFAPWGPFQFGHTHPEYSTSGLGSILAMAYAATGKTRDLTLADVQKPELASMLSTLEGRVIHYGESTDFLADQMFTRGPAYLSAAVLYENMVVQSYDRQRYPTTNPPVVAIYPREGTFWSDHPYAILNAPWVTPEQKAAAETFRTFLLDKPQQAQALQLGFRPADPSAPLGAPIVAANGVDSTQPQTQFDLPSVAVSAAVQALWGQNKKRAEVLVVLDVSGSMQSGGRLEPAKAALRDFISQLNDNDSFGLTTFGTTATVRSALGPLGPKRSALLDQINGLVPEGDTRLIETMREAYTTLSKEPAGERIRALVVLSDGPDSSRTTGSAQTLLKTMKSDVQGTGIKVFTVIYSSGGIHNADLFKQIATATGAKTYQAPVDTIQQVYRDIATFL